MSVQYLFSLPVNRIPFVQSSIGVQLHTFQSPLSVNILIWTSNIRQFWHFFFEQSFDFGAYHHLYPRFVGESNLAIETPSKVTVWLVSILKKIGISRDFKQHSESRLFVPRYG